jgi:PKD repeat protein
LHGRRTFENMTINQLKPFYILALLCSTITASGQPVANFSASVVSGCAPLVVQFTDNSTGSPTTWSWTLGNGAVSTQRNPVTTYTNAGVYTITLTASNASGSNAITKTQYITVYDKPVVRYTVSDSVACVPFSTTFTDLSSSSQGSINTWRWDFDDGTTSTLQDPQHTYTLPGNYNISLKVTNTGGCTNSLSKRAYIKAADDIRPQFIFTQPTKCKPPETVTFTNNSVGPGPLLYTWYFGDGTTSSATSPAHNYTTAGNYTVKLIARNNLGCIDSVSYTDAFTIKNVQSSIVGADSICVNTQMTLINGSTPAPLSSIWAFTDGTSSFGSTTSKTWTTAGNYTIKLTSNYNTCSDSVSKRVTVVAAPAISFSASDSVSCKAPFNVTFTDLTPGAVTWLWDFGDGGTSTLKNPSHTFTSEGEYAIKLTASIAGGCSASLTQYRLIRIAKPVINVDLRQGGGCKPYTFIPDPNVSSVDGIVSWHWDFGDGNTSNNRFPVEVYADSGTYDIKLTVVSTDGCVDSSFIPAGVRVGNHPFVDFALSPTVVCPGVDVQFTDLSVPADRWVWHFTNGDTSELQNPSHKFSDSGRYAIKLIAWNNGCSDSIIKSRALTVLPGLARFRPVFNCVNKTEVFFKDSSILPESWQWNYGDGGNDNTSNPTHLFAGYQPYTVSLTTTSGICTNTKTLVVTPINEVPDFVATSVKFCSPDSTVFYMRNFNKNNIASYVWDFGDGIVDSTSGDSVLHAYTRGGKYKVSLTAIDRNGCSNTTVKTDFITVNEPRAGFAVNALGGCRNKDVTFIDTVSSTNGNIKMAKWFWDFGDGNTQMFTAPPPTTVTHAYADAGNYFPSLKIVDSLGCADSVTHINPLRIYQPAAVFFSANANTCINDTLIIRNPSTGNHLSYEWSFGDGTSSPDSLPIKKYTADGDYTIKLIVTDAAGCKDSTERLNYIKVRTVTASFKVSDSVGTCTPLEVSFTNNSTDALSQLWDFGDGGFSSTVNPVYYYTTPGVYYAKLTSSRTTHCAASDSILMTIGGPSATLQYSPVPGCSPLDVSFSVAGSKLLSYTWDFNDGESFETSDSVATHTYNDPGNFIPSVIVKDSGGCVVALTGRDTVKVYSTKVGFTAIDTSLCSGDSVYFSDTSYSGSTIATYRWEFGDGNISVVENPTHFYTSNGSYTVKLFITTIGGCSDSLIKPDYIKIFATPQIFIAGNNTTYCGPQSISLTGNNLTGDGSAARLELDFWQWEYIIITKPVASTIQ